jgi:hypothetical protein
MPHELAAIVLPALLTILNFFWLISESLIDTNHHQHLKNENYLHMAAIEREICRASAAIRAKTKLKHNWLISHAGWLRYFM